MPFLTDSVELVLLSSATDEMIDEALEAVADATPQPEKLRRAFYERRSAMSAYELPEALWLLRDRDGYIGWSGWAPYLERPEHWQTTTYFATTYRGSGLFERARCHQLHATGTVARWATQEGRPAPTFVSSIAAWNERSFRASSRYAAANGWPDTWEQVFEPIADRQAHVFTYPYPELAHPCYRTSR